MGPGAAVTSRLVDADGQPRANAQLSVHVLAHDSRAPFFPYYPGWFRTDKDGRFRLEALLVGEQYFVNSEGRRILFSDGLRAGETKDLGDVQVKRADQ